MVYFSYWCRPFYDAGIFITVSPESFLIRRQKVQFGQVIKAIRKSQLHLKWMKDFQQVVKQVL